MLPRNIAENLSSAREQGLIGDYASAVVYYEGVLQQIKRLFHPSPSTKCVLFSHVRTVSDPNLSTQWHTCRRVIQDELELVKEIDKELKLFKQPRPSVPVDNVLRQLPVSS